MSKNIKADVLEDEVRLFPHLESREWNKNSTITFSFTPYQA